MHLIDFYLKLARFSDFLPIIPILLGLAKWEKLSIGLKCFLGFLIVDLMINFASYNIRGNDNRFLGYFYSFGYCSFILSTYYFFFEDLRDKKIMVFLFFGCLISLSYDFFYISSSNQNYFSGIFINLSIIGIGIYYFSKCFFQRKKRISEVNILISIVITFQFCFKIIENLLDNFLIQTQNNNFLWVQMQNIYYYFMILSLLTTSFIFYKMKFNEHKK